MATLVFMDESGLSPLMPGVYVTVTDALGDVIGTGWTFADGSVDIPIEGAKPYMATFRSSQLTSGLSVSFFGNALPVPAGVIPSPNQIAATTVVPVPGATPTLFSQAGGAALLSGLLPDGWFAKSELVPGGGAYAINDGVASGLSTMDASIARLIASMRGQTAQGPDLDSWANDFFGPWVQRYPGETDSTFYTRCVALMGQRRTLAAIKNIVIAWYAATLQERIVAAQPNLSFDQSGAIDETGGYDTFVPPVNPATLTPSVDVWDAVSQPTLATTYSIDTPQFVIQIGFTGAVLSWFSDRSFLDIDTYLIDQTTITTSTTPPDARLGALVALVKAAGTVPVYQVTSTL